MTLQLKNFIAQNGERFSQLYELNSNGFPLFYPTAYSTRNLRTGYAHNTQKEHLLAIKKLYEWAESCLQTSTGESLDIHERLVRQKFFTPYEIDALVSFVSVKRNSLDGEVLTGAKVNNQLTAIARYISWYAEEVITDSNKLEVQSSITKMSNMILAKKVRESSRTRTAQKTLAKKLPDEAREKLLDLFNNPLKGVEKKANFGSRIRNITELRVLYDTGMRIGELHGLRLSDFQMAFGGEPATLNVVRYHDDVNDDRVDQPVAKTLARPIPIDEELSSFIANYIKNWRSKVPNVGFDDNDFLFVIHRKGSRQGKASTISSFNSGIETLKKHTPSLATLHPHLLRHDWNYRFSLKAKELGYNEKEEQSIREFLMGWVDNSQSAALYNRRRIQEKAFELGVQVASHTVTRKLNNGKC
ncbi:MAG: site-specific integrase [Pseudomonadota bacterium]|uniref:tyrosine-type recombinase/integrase n=1 Tax=Methylophaga sp. TaxID=2024840 RepID=UPI0023B74734|nr:site-specific integrase [Pseudomonadota bacterium]